MLFTQNSCKLILFSFRNHTLLIPFNFTWKKKYNHVLELVLLWVLLLMFACIFYQVWHLAAVVTAILCMCTDGVLYAHKSTHLINLVNKIFCTLLTQFQLHSKSNDLKLNLLPQPSKTLLTMQINLTEQRILSAVWVAER